MDYPSIPTAQQLDAVAAIRKTDSDQDGWSELHRLAGVLCVGGRGTITDAQRELREAREDRDVVLQRLDELERFGYRTE